MLFVTVSECTYEKIRSDEEGIKIVAPKIILLIKVYSLLRFDVCVHVTS